MISLRGHFEEFLDDDVIKGELVGARSEEEFREMVDCLAKEKEQQRAYEEYAGEMQKYYDGKAKTTDRKVNNA